MEVPEREKEARQRIAEAKIAKIQLIDALSEITEKKTSWKTPCLNLALQTKELSPEE